jgi:hypothetical protein
LPELKKAIGRDNDQKKDKGDTKKSQKPSGSICKENYDDYDDDYGYCDGYADQNYSHDVNKTYLEPLVDLIESEYESKVYKIKKMIDNVRSKKHNIF